MYPVVSSGEMKQERNTVRKMRYCTVVDDKDTSRSAVPHGTVGKLAHEPTPIFLPLPSVNAVGDRKGDSDHTANLHSGSWQM